MTSIRLRPALLLFSSAGVSTAASISARKLSNGTTRSIISNGSPFAEIAASRLSASKKPSCPIVPKSANREITNQIRMIRRMSPFFEVPISQLLGNIEVIGEWVRQHNRDIIKKRCSTRFYIEPWFDHKKLRKDLADSGDRSGSLPNEFTSYVAGGQAYFVARVSVRDERLKSKDGWLYLELGFGLEVRKESFVRFFVYTELSGKLSGNRLKSEDTHEASEYFTKFPTTEHAAFKMFASCLRDSQKRAAKKTSPGAKHNLIQEIVIPHVTRSAA
jgi:hypothetical protein